MNEYDMKFDGKKPYENGVIRSNSEGKGRYDLISPVAMRRLAAVCEKGGLQKGDRNWEKGFNMSRGMDSTLRHLNQYLQGLRDEDHLAHAMWNIMTLIHFDELIKNNKMSSELNDLPNYEEEQK